MASTRRNRGILVEFEPMSPEEIERTVQFLLRQQAQFAADFEKLSAKTDRMTEGIVGLTAIVGHLHAAHQRTDEQFKRTDTRLNELGEYIKTVESHLNVLIEMFERHLREDHGHRPS
jgi:septal ring factor EnvC (AmiA/AmiB activator)